MRDVILEDLRRDVSADDSAEGTPCERGPPSRSGDEGDDDAGRDHNGHGHDAGDEGGEGLVAPRGAHRALHEDRVEDLPGRGRERHVTDEHRQHQAGGDSPEASGELAPVPGVGGQATRLGPARRGLAVGLGAGSAPRWGRWVAGALSAREERPAVSADADERARGARGVSLWCRTRRRWGRRAGRRWGRPWCPPFVSMRYFVSTVVEGRASACIGSAFSRIEGKHTAGGRPAYLPSPR